MQTFQILQYPYMTEKSVSLIEKENKIVFVVDITADNKQIKSAVEKEFDVKVEKIGTMIDFKGRKKAFVKLRSEFRAVDVATKLGLV